MGTEYWNGAEAAHRRVMMKAAGYSDDDIRKKPHIGVPNLHMQDHRDQLIFGRLQKQ